jgi:hypothetical protein
MAPKILSLIVCLGLCFVTAGPAHAETPCLEAVFFDLGNTLVENPGNGIHELRPGAVETVTALQGLGIRLGIITNVPSGWDIDDLRALLAEPEFLDEFEVVILSSEAPAAKPNPAIYTFAHEALAEPRPPITSTAFVGETLSEIANSVENPTLGARSVGMIGIHLSDAAPSPFTDFTIPTDELMQVATIVTESCDLTGVIELPGGSESELLHQPWPNPSGGDSRIEFTANGETHVRIQVFDLTGRRVAELIDRSVSAGRHGVSWDGRDEQGRAVPSGVYFATLRTSMESRRVKVLRIR